MLIHAAERRDGLEDAVLASGRVTLTAAAARAEPVRLATRHADIARAALRIKVGEPQLYFMKAVLATTGWGVCPERKLPFCWNFNDDVFCPVQTWEARHTPEDKPVNYQHSVPDIIGHITANTAVDAAGNPIPDDCLVDDLPDKYHLAVGSVLYKVWDDEKLQDRMDALIAGIEKDVPEWYVSMECLFGGFDYALADDDGTCRLVARDKTTAHLTKYLRAFDEENVHGGRYEGRRIGRVMRGMTFSGMGMVRRPGNPDSVIIATAEEKSDHSKKLGYCSVTEKITGAKQEERPAMAVEIETLQKQLAEVIADRDRLKAQQTETSAKEADELKARLAAADKAKAEHVAEIAALKSVVKSAEEKVAAVEGQWKAAAAELEDIKVKARTADRLTKVKAVLKVNESDADAVKAAATLAESLTALADDKFDAYLVAQAKFTPAPLPPKGTPAPLPKQSTAALELEGAEPNADIALATETDPAAEGARKRIAARYGYVEADDK